MATSFAPVSAMSVVTGSGKLAPVSAIPVVVVSDGSVKVGPGMAQPVIQVAAGFPRTKTDPIPIVYAVGSPAVAKVDPIPIYVTASTGGGYPSAGNTGPAAGTVFTTTTGNFNTSAPGQIVEKRIINNGMVIVRHANVTVRDCVINSQDSAAISSVGAALSGCIIERCTLTGIGGANGISPDFMTGVEIRFCDISGYVNGIAIGDTGMNIHDNYIHGLFGISAGAHVDGIQGSGGFTSLTIRHNTIVSWDTSCIIMQTEGGGFSGLVIDDNRCLFDTAHVGSELAYGILVQSINANVAQNITITNNRIQKSWAGQNYIFIKSLTNPVTITGNVDDTTGAPVTADIG